MNITKTAIKRLLILVAALTLGGCAGRNMIIGFGVVNIQPDKNGVRVVDSSVVGLSVSDHKTAFGVSKVTEVYVPSSATNVLIEIKK